MRASSSNFQKTGLSLAEMFFTDVNAMIILNKYIYNHKYTLQIVAIVKERSMEELNAQLVSPVGENGAEMLISAFRSRKSTSGPELSAIHSP